MMTRVNYKTVAIFLIIFGAALRLFWLGGYPSGFFRDEAAIGFNAYSIWQTGRDEYGLFLPLAFRSFEQFFLPLYFYISAPIVGILGLSEFSTRLLSSISGIAALGLVYFIALEIWNKKAAPFAVLVLTVAPWHIFYSRGTFEANLALTLFAGGFLFWLKFLKRNRNILLFLSALFFTASIYSYHAERLVVPAFGLVAISIAYKRLWKIRMRLLLSGAVILILLLPLLLLSFKPGGYHRAFGVSIFSQKAKPPGWVEGEEAGLFINNEVYLKGRQVAALYLSYFSPRNLFIEGDYDRQRSVENFSVFYAWMLPFLFWGIWHAARHHTTEEKLLFSWLFLAPIPAAVTGDPFHTSRSLLLYMPLSIFIGLGLAKAFDLTKRKYKTCRFASFTCKAWFLIGITFLSTASLSLFLFNYLVLTQTTRARAWDSGYAEIVQFVNTLPSDTRVVVDDPVTEAYIYFLFFGKVNPRIYQEEVKKLGSLARYYYTNANEIRPNKLGTHEFRPVDWPTERGVSGTVFVMTAERLPESEFITDPKIELLKEIKYPDGEVAYRVVRVL